jgi:hypothetical protein
MRFSLHGEALDGGIERRPFRHRPRQHHPLVLQPKVVVKVAGAVLLHDELKGGTGGSSGPFAHWLAGRFGRHVEAAFALVLGQAAVAAQIGQVGMPNLCRHRNAL